MNIKTENLFEKLIDNMMKETNHNPRDYCFRYIVSMYPKEVHDAFDFPGEYMDNLKVEVFTEDGRNLKMDCAQLVMPKGDITCKSTINVEHQTYPIHDEKVGTIYDYKLFLIHKTNIPSNSIVMTNKDLGKEIINCETHDQLFKLHVEVATKEKISKRLKILKDIEKSNLELPRKEAMYFAYISIFTDEKNAKEDMEEIAKIFSKIDKIESNLELHIHQVLKKMIKFHFRDDENKCRELIIMISESIFQKNLEGLTYKEISEIRMDELNQQMKQKDKQMKEIENENQQLKQQLKELKQQKKRMK